MNRAYCSSGDSFIFLIGTLKYKHIKIQGLCVSLHVTMTTIKRLYLKVIALETVVNATVMAIKVVNTFI